MKWVAVLLVVALVAIDGLTALNLHHSPETEIDSSASREHGLPSPEEHLREFNHHNRNGGAATLNLHHTLETEIDSTASREHGLPSHEEHLREFNHHNRNGGAAIQDGNTQAELERRHSEEINRYGAQQDSQSSSGQEGLLQSHLTPRRSGYTTGNTEEYNIPHSIDHETSHLGGIPVHRHSQLGSNEENKEYQQSNLHSAYPYQGQGNLGSEYQGLLNSNQEGSVHNNIERTHPLRQTHISHKPSHVTSGVSETFGNNQNGNFGSLPVHHGAIANEGSFSGGHLNGLWNHAQNSEQLLREAGHQHANHIVSGTEIQQPGADTPQYINLSPGIDASKVLTESGYVNEDFTGVLNQGLHKAHFVNGNENQGKSSEYLNASPFKFNHVRGVVNHPVVVANQATVAGKYPNGDFVHGGGNTNQYATEDVHEDGNSQYLSDILSQAQHLLKHKAVSSGYGIIPSHYHSVPSNRGPVYGIPNSGIRFYDSATGSYMINPSSAADDDSFGEVGHGYVSPTRIVSGLNSYPNGYNSRPSYYRNGDFSTGLRYIHGTEKTGPTTIFGRVGPVLPISTIPVSNDANKDNSGVPIDKTLTSAPLTHVSPLSPSTPSNNGYEGTSRDASDIIIDLLSKHVTTTHGSDVNKDFTDENTHATHADSDTGGTSINGDIIEKKPTHSDKHGTDNEKIDNTTTEITQIIGNNNGSDVTGNGHATKLGQSIVIDKTEEIKKTSKNRKNDDKNEKIVDNNKKVSEKYDGSEVTGKDNDVTTKNSKSILKNETTVIKQSEKDVKDDGSKDKTTVTTVSGADDKSGPIDNNDDETDKPVKTIKMNKTTVETESLGKVGGSDSIDDKKTIVTDEPSGIENTDTDLKNNGKKGKTNDDDSDNNTTTKPLSINNDNNETDGTKKSLVNNTDNDNVTKDKSGETSKDNKTSIDQKTQSMKNKRDGTNDGNENKFENSDDSCNDDSDDDNDEFDKGENGGIKDKRPNEITKVLVDNNDHDTDSANSSNKNDASDKNGNLTVTNEKPKTGYIKSNSSSNKDCEESDGDTGNSGNGKSGSNDGGNDENLTKTEGAENHDVSSYEDCDETYEDNKSSVTSRNEHKIRNETINVLRQKGQTNNDGDSADSNDSRTASKSTMNSTKTLEENTNKSKISTKNGEGSGHDDKPREGGNPAVINKQHKHKTHHHRHAFHNGNKIISKNLTREHTASRDNTESTDANSSDDKTSTEKHTTSGSKKSVTTHTLNTKTRATSRSTPNAFKRINSKTSQLAKIALQILHNNSKKSKINIDDASNNFVGSKNTTDSTKSTKTDDEKTQDNNNGSTANNNGSNNCDDGESNSSTTNANNTHTSDSQSNATQASNDSENREAQSSPSASEYGSDSKEESLENEGGKSTHSRSLDNNEHYEQQKDSKFTEETQNSKGKTVESVQSSDSKEGNTSSSDNCSEETDGKSKDIKQDSSSSDDKKVQDASSSDSEKVDGDIKESADSSSDMESAKSDQSTGEESSSSN